MPRSVAMTAFTNRSASGPSHPGRHPGRIADRDLLSAECRVQGEQLQVKPAVDSYLALCARCNDAQQRPFEFPSAKDRRSGEQYQPGAEQQQYRAQPWEIARGDGHARLLRSYAAACCQTMPLSHAGKSHPAPATSNHDW